MSPLDGPPASAGALGGFPRFRLAAGTGMARIHRKAHHPVWFSHDGEGRFDLRPPGGTLYAAARPLGAFVEVFRDVGVVPHEEVDARRLSTLAASRDLVVADCTSRRARGFGITAAIHSTPDYGMTQAWAAAFAAAGLDGVRYLASHDPAQRLIGYALFGSAGAAGGRGWTVERSEPLSPALLREARETFGLLALATLLSPP